MNTELGCHLTSIAKAGHWNWGSASKEAPGSALKIQKQMAVAHLLASQDTPHSPEGHFFWWKYLGSLAYLPSCSFFPSLSPNVSEEEGERERGVPYSMLVSFRLFIDPETPDFGAEERYRKNDRFPPSVPLSFQVQRLGRPFSTVITVEHLPRAKAGPFF